MGSDSGGSHPSVEYRTLQISMVWLCDCGAMNTSKADQLTTELDNDGRTYSFDVPAKPVKCNGCGNEYWLAKPGQLTNELSDRLFEVELEEDEDVPDELDEDDSFQ